MEEKILVEFNREIDKKILKDLRRIAFYKELRREIVAGISRELSREEIETIRNETMQNRTSRKVVKVNWNTEGF